MKLRLHAFISGRVQGVFFRSTTREVARKLGIRGWVRNLPDGRVEVVAEGEKEKLEELLNFLRRGPRAAKVERVKVTWEDFKGEFNDFTIVY